MSYPKNSQKSSNPLTDSNVAWNASNLFYIYLNELDMDYRDSYYIDDWNKMYKVFELKYMKVQPYIEKHQTKEEKAVLNDDETIRNKIGGFKDGESDHVDRFNNAIVNEICDTIKYKMKLVDRLMSKAGMNILLEKVKRDLPAAFSTDDFIQN